MTKVHCDDIRDQFGKSDPDFRIDSNTIHINEDRLDLWSGTKRVIPDWEPKVTLPPYESLSKVYCDIETNLIPMGTKQETRDYARLGSARVRMIGTRNDAGKNLIFDSGNTSEPENLYFGRLTEKQILIRWKAQMDAKQPDVIFFHNGYAFDIPYLHARFLFHGLESPFWAGYDYKQRTFQAAILAGKPFAAKFWNFKCFFGGKECQIIDTMFLAISHDAVFREFSSVSLKVVPVELGLRPGKRLDMSTHEMQAAYDSGDYSRMREYLEYDLEDTQLLADYFMPTLYPQQYYFPGYTLRNLAVVGGGSKWQNAIAACYPQSYTDSLEDTPKLKYQGALTYTRCGLFRDVIGVDLSGAYPNANIFYGICSEKDPEMWSLAILKHAVKSRNAIKYKENITAYDESLAKAAKPVINSQYGSCASKIPYGDPAAAAITTAFTRARLKWLRGYVESLGGTVVLQDTDSCFFYFPVSPGVLPIPKSGKVTLADSPQGLPQFLPGLTVARLLKEASPPGVDLDLDSINRVMFVPPIAVKADYRKNYKLSSVNGRKFARKHLGDSVDSPLFDKLLSQYGSDKVSYELLKVLAEALQVQFPGVEGLKKNYIKFKWDKKSNDWVIELKGRFVKRDCTDLERTYQRNFILKYLGSPLDAEVYHQDTLQRISDQTYPVEFLTTNRKIRITEKTLVARGLGQPRETISFYQGVDGPTKNGPYDSHFYIQKVERMYQEIKEMIALEPEVETVLEICS